MGRGSNVDLLRAPGSGVYLVQRREIRRRTWGEGRLVRLTGMLHADRRRGGTAEAFHQSQPARVAQGDQAASIAGAGSAGVGGREEVKWKEMANFRAECLAGLLHVAPALLFAMQVGAQEPPSLTAADRH